MHTPAGKECRYYYEDFHRGREMQECRLIKANPNSMAWVPADCSRCPVPEILNANASKNLEMTLAAVPKLLGFRREMKVEARCLKHDVDIEDAFVGCPQCNAERPGLDVFWQALEQSDDD